MKKITKTTTLFCTVFAASLFMTTTCFAQDPFTKLGRGVANTLTGWIELPKNIYNTGTESNAFAGVTLGLARGVGMTVVRTAAGIYDVVTFPFPLPQDYKPILQPEYAF